MKIQVLWQGKPVPQQFDFLGSCTIGSPIPIAAPTTDEHPKNAPSPKELVLQGLAACTGIDVVSTFLKMRQPVQGLKIDCDGKQTLDHPKIFSHCALTYHIDGNGLDAERIAYAVSLSLLKYCGVSIMLEKSGCKIAPRLFVNGTEVDIWDPLEKNSAKLKDWFEKVQNKCPRGLALVTGVSRGIGNELCKSLAKEGFAVLPAGRSPFQFQTETIFETQFLDLSTTLSIEAFVHILKKSQLKFSLVVQNSGIAWTHESKQQDAAEVEWNEIRSIYEVNLFGLIELNNALAPLLHDSALLAFASSTMGHPSRDDDTWSAYRLSKRSVSQFAHQLAIHLAKRCQNQAVLSYHPGSVITQLNPTGKISVKESVERLVHLFKAEMLPKVKENNGHFWSYDEAAREWKIFL